MFTIVLSVIVFIVQWFINAMPAPDAFMYAAKFMLYLNLLWAALSAFIFFVFWIALIVGATWAKGPVLGIAAAGISLVALALLVFNHSLRIFASFMLMTSYSNGHWDVIRLIVAIVLLVIQLFTGSVKISSSSSSRKD